MLCRRAKLRFMIFGFLLVLSAAALALENQLRHHASPYLAMHGSDPVAWQLWNRQSFELARKEGKLLYVSSGYFSCHWCHVMQHESYQDSQIARLLNENFIPVKVDREIEPALDSRLIDFVERTQGHAGWPLNIFITPEGYPLVGMTYLPASNFIEVLNKLRLKWKRERSELEKIARNATKELTTTSDSNQVENKVNKKSGKKFINDFLIQARSMADDLSGGFGEQSKFPSVPQLSVLLRLYNQNNDIHLRQFLTLTLDNMTSQGLYDQLGGGFFRYAIDPQWQTPHFEKMLYDNALLASLYMDAAKILKNPQYDVIAKTTLDFMLSSFQSSQGGMIASLSAIDGNGVEGGYYLWKTDEIKKILDPMEFSLVKQLWNLNAVPDLKAGHHLVMATSLAAAAKKLSIDKEYAERNFSSAKRKLQSVRNKRLLPRDNKILAGWNGLALSALSQGAREYNSKKYEMAATALKEYIYKNLWRNRVLVRAVKNNMTYGQVDLGDYAYVSKGLNDWLSIKGNKKDQGWLNKMIVQGWSRFYIKGEWLRSENGLLKYKQGEKVIVDDVLPSASAIMIRTTIDLCNKTHDKNLMKKALHALNVLTHEMSEQPFWYANHIFTLYTLQNINKK